MAGTLIVALDLDSRAEAETLIERLGDAVDFYKIGYQLFYGGDGLALGKALIAAGKRVFFDLKLLDIDNTVEKGVAAIARTGADMLTVHAYPQCMRAAAQGRRGVGPHHPRRLGADLDGRRRRRRSRVCPRHGGSGGAARRTGQGRRGRRAGVLAARGARWCARIVGPDMAIVTPGIRPDRQRGGRPEAGHGPGRGDRGGRHAIWSSAGRSRPLPIRGRRRRRSSPRCTATRLHSGGVPLAPSRHRRGGLEEIP